MNMCILEKVVWPKMISMLYLPVKMLKKPSQLF